MDKYIYKINNFPVIQPVNQVPHRTTKNQRHGIKLQTDWNLYHINNNTNYSTDIDYDKKIVSEMCKHPKGSAFILNMDNAQKWQDINVLKEIQPADYDTLGTIIKKNDK